MTIKKVLLVDDSKTELHHLSDMLSKRGYSVRTAENGEEAMRRLATHGIVAGPGEVEAEPSPALAEQVNSLMAARRLTGLADDALVNDKLRPVRWPVLPDGEGSRR